VNRRLGGLAHADDQQALGRDSRRRMQHQGFAGSGLEFTRSENRGGGRFHSLVRGEQHRPRLCVRLFAGLCIDGRDREQFNFQC